MTSVPGNTKILSRLCGGPPFKSVAAKLAQSRSSAYTRSPACGGVADATLANRASANATTTEAANIPLLVCIRSPRGFSPDRAQAETVQVPCSACDSGFTRIPPQSPSREVSCAPGLRGGYPWGLAPHRRSSRTVDANVNSKTFRDRSPFAGMPEAHKLGVIGDYDPGLLSHQSTSNAFRHAAAHLRVDVDLGWVPTSSLEGHAREKLGEFDALLCAPGSPYKSMTGALNGIRFAREFDRPFLGTCGGFQHVVVEYARNVMGFEDAQHAEYDPYASRLFITPLTCSLVGKTMKVRIIDGSGASAVYGRKEVEEQYYCNFGLNPHHRAALEDAGLGVSGIDQDDEVRILELPDKRFFMATLFVPQLTSTKNSPHP